MPPTEVVNTEAGGDTYIVTDIQTEVAAQSEQQQGGAPAAGADAAESQLQGQG